MRKTLLIGLAILAAGAIVSCSSPKPTNTPEFVSPLRQADKSTFVSPLEATVGETIRFPGKIAFHSDRTGVLQVYVLHGASGDVERLTDGRTQSFEPSWSPDCQYLAYAHGDNTNEGFDIFTMRADGSESTQLVKNPGVDDWSPSWSPKGDLIAYQTNEGGFLNVCWVDLDGESQGCLESRSYSNALPAWSPDGKKILFISNRDGGDWDIFVTDLDEKGEANQLTSNDDTDTSPQFSPDGRQVLFASERLDNFDIFSINSDGTNEIRMITHLAEDVNPHWVGDDLIVFSSARSLDWDLYLASGDGGDVTQLTDVNGLDKWPTWCASE